LDPERLGPYRILEPLGSGGMGKVYLAEDSRLGRRVAIKMLPSSADRVALDRFVREARTTAALQHPHIAVLLDVGEEAGAPYLVLERIDGESLLEALSRGALPWQQVLEIGEQIASALSHAHGIGVLHRDIKPGNIMLSPSRGAVLLDFGLVHYFRRPSADPSASPTQTVGGLTREGAIAGTALYMSAEQLSGETLDGRSDLFQLGIVMYEAVSGGHPFRGPTVVDIQHAILHAQPRPLQEFSGVPDEFARVVAKLLEKDPRYRYPDARALEVDLRALRRDSSAEAVLSSGLLAPRGRRRSRRRVFISAIALGLLALAVALLWWRSDRPGPSPSTPSRIFPLTHGKADDGEPAFSPEGKSVVFVSQRGGNWDLWISLVAAGSPVQITDTPEVESQPDWSPDGTRMAFTRRRKDGPGQDIYLMPALGGDALLLVEQASDPSWSPDGEWIAYADLSRGWFNIARIAVDSRDAPVAVTKLEESYFHRNPSWTPDGETIVYNRSPGGLSGQLMRIPSRGGRPRQITDDPAGTANVTAVVTPDGRYVVHVSDRGGALNLWRVPIDGGEPERITSGAGRDLTPAVSPDGRYIAFALAPIDSRIFAFAPGGGSPGVLAELGEAQAWAPGLSSDGTQIVFSRKVPGSPWRMVLLPRGGGVPRTVLEGVPDVFWTRFFPDGETLVFHANMPIGGRIGRVRVDGGGLVWLTGEDEDAGYPAVSPDGRQLAFARVGGGTEAVVLRDLADGSERVVAENATLPSFSPDGRALAFARSRSYSGGVGFVGLEDGEPRWLTESGTWPVWMPDGLAIAYADAGPEGDQLAWIVPLDGGPVRPGKVAWVGPHWPFVIDPKTGELITSDSGTRQSTIWLAEFE
jgi:Tol biopolymer transport system component